MADSVRHEPGDINVRATLIAALAIFSLAGVSALIGAVMLRHAATTVRSAPATAPAPLQPYTEYEAAKRSALQSFGWVDRDAGIAHIPIDQAISLMAGE